MILDRIFRNVGASGGARWRHLSIHLPVYLSLSLWFAGGMCLVVVTAIPLRAREKNAIHYGAGLIVNIPLPEPEVAQVVEETSQNTLIRGTKEYSKDEYVSGAVAGKSTPVFPAWTEGGKVFYKVRQHALDPQNFQNSGDTGTLAVRYVVQPQGDKNTVLRIDAAFVEDFRRGVHQSNGSVEGAEYKDIQDRLQAVELVKKETEEALRAKEERQTKQSFSSSVSSDREVLGTPASTGASAGGQVVPSSPLVSAPGSGVSAGMQTSAAQQPGYEDSGESLEQHVASLRRQVERLVKQPGAPLKSAPFHTASTLKSLEPGAEVLILITTSYWYGVETHDGEHGWLRRDQLEQLP